MAAERDSPAPVQDAEGLNRRRQDILGRALLATVDPQESFPLEAPNPSALPYTVRVDGWRLTARILAYGGMMVLSASIIVSIVREGEAYMSPMRLAILGAWLVVCALQLVRLRRPEAVFYVDRVEKVELLGRAVLHRANIEGVGNIVQTRYGAVFDIVSSSREERSLQLSGALRSDPIVAEWLRGAPDPQAEALKADRARVLADPRYGADESARRTRLERAKRLALVVNIGAMALAAWLGLFASVTAATFVTAVSPAVLGALLVWRSQGLLVWYDRRSVRPGVVGCLAPAGALAVRAAFTTHLVSQGYLPWLAVLMGAYAGLLTYLRLGRSSTPLRSAVLSGAVGTLAAYGAMMMVNVGLDGSPVHSFVTTVTDAHVHEGRSSSYYLDLAAWDDQPGGEVAVSQSLYDSAPVGAPVCVNRRAGALGRAWFDVVLCPEGRAATPVQGKAKAGSAADQPDWIRTPTGQDLADLYPEKAERMEKAGYASISCSVQVSGTLSDCKIVEETPPGWGFGEASLEAAGRFRMRPARMRGRPVPGGRVTIPIRWQLGG